MVMSGSFIFQPDKKTKKISSMFLWRKMVWHNTRCISMVSKFWCWMLPLARLSLFCHRRLHPNKRIPSMGFWQFYRKVEGRFLCKTPWRIFQRDERDWDLQPYWSFKDWVCSRNITECQGCSDSVPNWKAAFMRYWSPPSVGAESIFDFVLGVGVALAPSATTGNGSLL